MSCAHSKNGFVLDFEFGSDPTFVAKLWYMYIVNHARSYSRQDGRWKATGNWKPSVSADSKPILKVFRIELKVLNLA